MFSFLKSLGRSPRRTSAPRRPRSSHRPLLEQLGSGLFQGSSGRQPESTKPVVEALEERQLMSIVVGGGLGGLTLGGGTGSLSLVGQPQPLSNMSSVTDLFGHTYFFQINADQTVSFTSMSAPSGVWQITGVKAVSVSAGTDIGGNAVVGIIKPDQSVWVFDTDSLDADNGALTGYRGATWTNLGGKALSISVTQGPQGASGLVYVIGTNYNLYVQDTGGHGWFGLGTPALSNNQHVSLDTISALSYRAPGGPYGLVPASVCYATDNVGEVWQLTLNDTYPNDQYGGTWKLLGGPGAVQIAAGFNAYDEPIVYALGYNQFSNVSVFDGGWTNLGGDALEISASRSWDGADSRNTVYAIIDSHQVSVLNNSAFTDWIHVNTATGPTWQSLGGYATAISAEAIQPGQLFHGVFAEGANNYAYIYNNGWGSLFGQQMNQSYTPLNY